MANKSIAVLYGRMNPPTKGHEENIEGLKKIAKKENADHIVIASHSHDPKKNPLTAEQKLKHLKRAFPNTNVITSSKERPSIFHHLDHLYSQGYRHFHIVSGEDRQEDYDKIKKYYGPGTERPDATVNVASSGERKEGISGTAMREHVKNGNFNEFRKNLPSKLSSNESHAKDLFNDVKSGMEAAPVKKTTKLKESFKDWLSLSDGIDYDDFDDVREHYIKGRLFRIGEEVVNKDNVVYSVVSREKNYVVVENAFGVFKEWIKDISSLDEEKKKCNSVMIANGEKSEDAIKASNKYRRKIYVGEDVAEEAFSVVDGAPTSSTASKKNNGNNKKDSVGQPDIVIATGQKHMDDVYRDNKRKSFKSFETSTQYKEEKEIPRLLMTKEQIAEAQAKASGDQVSYDGYTTKNFDVEPRAKETFQDLIKTIPEPMAKQVSAEHEKQMQVQVGALVKPMGFRHQQFKQYLNL